MKTPLKMPVATAAVPMSPTGDGTSTESDMEAMTPNRGDSLDTESKRVCDTGKPGRIRIRIVSAANLPPVMNLFRWGTADPYALLVLEDRTNRKQSPHHRTRRATRTLNPRWREDFWFAIVQGMVNLNLHVEVWHYNDDMDDTFLGQLDIDLRPYLLDMSPSRGNFFELPEKALEPADCGADGELTQFLGQVKTSGTVKVEIAWEPALMVRSAVGPRTVISRLWNAPQALRVMRVVLFGGAGALLIVSRNARWLCRGDSLGDCQEIFVQGAPTAVSLSAMAVIVVTFIHFAGSSGFLGSAWTGEPVGLMDLLDNDLADQGEHPDDAQAESTLRMQIMNESLTKWSVSVGTAFLPKISFNVLRITAMLAYLVAFVLGFLAALLAWVAHGPDTCLGEAVYIDLYAMFCLFCGVGTSVREKQLILVADRDRWRTVGDTGDMVGRLASAANSPGLGLELVEEWARKGVSRLTQQAETLTQPFKDAWLPFQEQINGGQEKFRHSIDSLWGFHATSKSPERLSQPLLRKSGSVTSPAPGFRRQHRGDEDDIVAGGSLGAGAGRKRRRDRGAEREANFASTQDKANVSEVDAAVATSSASAALSAGGGRIRLGGLGLDEVSAPEADQPDLSSKSVCCRC